MNRYDRECLQAAIESKEAWYKKYMGLSKEYDELTAKYMSIAGPFMYVINATLYNGQHVKHYLTYDEKLSRDTLSAIFEKLKNGESVSYNNGNISLGEKTQMITIELVTHES